jgi:hypothetical protein
VGTIPDTGLVHWSSAVRPAPGVALTPIEGYRPKRLHRLANGWSPTALVVAADRSKSFDLFKALLEPLGPVVDVVLETSHFRTDGRHRDLRRDGVNKLGIVSYFNEFEDILTEDGCTGVAVLSTIVPWEVQFDEHKTIIIYAINRRPFKAILRRFGLRKRDDLVLVSEVKHIHHSSIDDAFKFRDLAKRLGM